MTDWEDGKINMCKNKGRASFATLGADWLMISFRELNVKIYLHSLGSRHAKQWQITQLM